MVDLESLRRHVADLSDEGLLEVNPADLTDAAREVYESEMAARGIAWPEAEESAAEAGEAAASELVSVAKYETSEEARFARALLENEGIPVWFLGELTPEKFRGNPLAGLEIVTKPEFLESAQILLNSEITDEELARQAEEAEPEAVPDESETPEEESN